MLTKCWATPKLGQVVAYAFQVVQTLGLGSCHLVQASLEIWSATLAGGHLLQVSHGLENFCLTLLEANHMVCVQAGLRKNWQLWNGHFNQLGHYMVQDKPCRHMALNAPSWPDSGGGCTSWPAKAHQWHRHTEQLCREVRDGNHNCEVPLLATHWGQFPLAGLLNDFMGSRSNINPNKTNRNATNLIDFDGLS